MKMKKHTQEGISIGFEVENVEEYMEKLNSMGYQTTDIISPNPKTKFFYVNDPDGLKIQLIEMR